MSTAAVTVVVPTRNRRAVLATTLAAVLGQVGVDLAVVVVDEGSSDGTPDDLAALAATDDRVTVVRHDQPKGLPAARNAGLARTGTRWVAFCDDDDLWAPTKLSAQLAALEQGGAAWSCTGAVFVASGTFEILGHQRPPATSEVLSELLRENVVPAGGSSVLADTELVRMAGGFDEDLNSSEDWDCWIRLAARSPVAAVDEPLVAYRIWPGSMSTDVARMRASRRAVLDRHAETASALGITSDDAAYERFLAKQLLRSGEGRRAAAQFLSLATGHRAWRELPRVLPALVAPHLTDRLGSARARHRVPPEWRASATGWLGAVREAVPA